MNGTSPGRILDVSLQKERLNLNESDLGHLLSPNCSPLDVSTSASVPITLSPLIKEAEIGGSVKRQSATRVCLLEGSQLPSGPKAKQGHQSKTGLEDVPEQVGAKPSQASASRVCL